MAYFDSLSGDERKRYYRKLQCLHGLVSNFDEEVARKLDPYSLPESAWIDDVIRWPPIDFPSIYVYLIETPGEFTREKLKTFKSLEAYNYYERYSSTQSFTCMYERCM